MAFKLQEYEFKVIHWPGITHQNVDTMSRRPFITSEDFSEAKQDFDQIPTIHVSYAFSYLTLVQCNLVEHLIVDIWEDLDIMKFLQHGEYLPQVASNQRDYIQQWSKCYSWRDNHFIWCLPQGDRMVPPPHECPSLIQKVHLELDTLELRVLIAFSLLITIGQVCMLKSETSLLGVNNVIKWELPFLLDNSRFLHSLFKACSIVGHVI